LTPFPAFELLRLGQRRSRRREVGLGQTQPALFVLRLEPRDQVPGLDLVTDRHIAPDQLPVVSRGW
jgi:hypothetical protein